MTELNAIKELFTPLSDNYIPRGYLGEIIKWANQGGKLNYATQVGIVIMSFCASRRYYSPTMSPVHLYTVAEGPGATGKKQVSNALIKLMTGIEYQSKIGPSEFKDIDALESFLENFPRSLLLTSKLENVRNFQDCWSSTGLITLQSGKNIYNPSSVLVVKSLTNDVKKFFTKDEFLKGTAGRLLVFSETKMGVDTFVAEYTPIATSVLSFLKQLAAGEGRDDSQFEVQPTALKWIDQKTSNLFDIFKKKMIELSSKSDLHEACYGESAEMMARIAALSALGRNSTTIDETDMSFATTLVVNSSNYLYQIASKS